MTPARTALTLALLIALIGGSCAPVLAATASAAADLSEYQVKGAFLINFIRLIEWQGVASAGSRPMSLCVLGDSPIVPVLESLVAAPVKGRQVVVRRIATVQNGMACDVLFISDARGNHLDAVIRAVSPGVLTVSEIDTEEPVGAVINFVVENDRVAFDVNLTAASRARIEPTSRLLGVARAVDGHRRRRQ